MPPPGRGFKNDLATGTAGERRFAAVAESAGLTAEPNRSPSLAGKARYDFQLDVPQHDTRAGVEVKYDVSEAKTGNVAVETANPKSRTGTGLTTTTAGVWVFVLKDQSVWAARVCDVRRAVSRADKEAGHVRFIPVAGDKNASVHLFRRGAFFALLFFRLDDLTPAEFAATMAVLAG
jgi:hypothetical protein